MTETMFEKLAWKFNRKRLRYRLIWATVWRKDRAARFKSYAALAAQVKGRLIEIWKILEIYPDKPLPELEFRTFKYQASVGFWFSWQGKESHFFHLGRKGRTQGAYLADMTRNDDIPYYTHPEILAAISIASLMKANVEGTQGRAIATEEEVNDILAMYHMNLVTEYGEAHPNEISDVWLNRLNTMLVNLWQTAPVLERAAQLEKTGLEFKKALDAAFEEIDIKSLGLPKGSTSNNEDGRRNLSYSGSCFYTIDRRGVAICKEFPSEWLDLSDYSVLLRVAATIYQDITECGEDDEGMLRAYYMFQDNEPEWMNANLFPWERGEQEQQEVEAA